MSDSKFNTPNGPANPAFSDGESMVEESLLEKSHQKTRKRPTLLSRLWIPAIFHGTIIIFYTMIFLTITDNAREEKGHGADVIHTPARSAMKFESHLFEVHQGGEISNYVGEPRPELDLAWHELLQHQNIRISADEMERLDRLDEGVQLPGGGYFASLTVYHQLHCIKRLHHYTYQDHYFPNITEKERHHNIVHNAHCLDMLRQAIMCQGDASLLTMRWGQKQPVPLGNFTSPHECVNWDRLESWAAKRSVDMFAPGVLVHPTLGPSFPGGDIERIGVVEDD